MSNLPSTEDAKAALDRSCYPIFERLYADLGERYHNWIVMIEPESEDYFLGQDDHEVLTRARKKHPKGSFFAYRLSENPTVDNL